MTLALLIGLAACGGGGGGGGGGSNDDDNPPDGNNDGGGGNVTAIAASQDTADDLVTDANNGVEKIRRADTSGLLPVGGALGAAALPTGATISDTQSCSTLGGSGSGTFSYSYTYDEGSGRPVSYRYTYDNCRFGTAGYNYTFDGTGSLVYSNWTSASDFSYTFTYDIDYSFTGGGLSRSGTIDVRQSCTSVAGDRDCDYVFDDNSRVRDISVQNSGTVTTVNRATIDGERIDIVYDDWTYDNDTGRATSGTVTVTDEDGNSAVITATGSGYTVVITVDGDVTTWTVTYSN